MLRFASSQALRPLVPRLLPRLAAARLAHTSIKAAIIDDHAELKEYFDNFMNAESKTDKAQWANQYRWELARHTVAEELVLYPAFEKYLGEEGTNAANEEREEHQTQKELQAQLESMDVTDPDFRDIFKELQYDLSEHVKGEESMLNKLEAKVSSDDSAALAASLARTKMFVPTRAHPGLPKSPPFETVGALLLAPVDKIRDLFEKFPEKESD